MDVRPLSDLLYHGILDHCNSAYRDSHQNKQRWVVVSLQSLVAELSKMPG